ncbi:hypothetical protein VFPPC_12039 [Pochonia chlamydosporia 170]|uniref:Uncharacterized protein n=1 Tax=Pochonia chlamydosporia 170 TaxID=1380566 RepID=A0A179G242_METCM|nr:hypothetical protein VFPPC_12039 [Pochonia chlamydosporia 170]OAQ71922.1 hypothetical protein VFPPC_12039 [Pochonia chlamydosporia 170]
MGKSGYKSRWSKPGFCGDAKKKPNKLYVVIVMDEPNSPIVWNEKYGIFSRGKGRTLSFYPRLEKTRSILESSVRDFIYRKNAPRGPRLVSGYSKRTIAVADAEGRKTDLKVRDVWIAEVDARKFHKRAQYENLRSLAGRLGIWFPHREDWVKSEFEYVIQSHIPRCAVQSLDPI